MTARENLNPTVEKALEPELPICDPHFHFFPNTPEKYVMEDLLQDISSGHNIVKNVYVDCHNGYRDTGPAELRPVGETEFVVDLVAQNEKNIPVKVKVAAGIVGAANLNLGEAVEPVLKAHITAGKGRFRGIRQTLIPMGTAAPETQGKRQAADKQLREGFACLDKLGLSFETMVNLPHLSQLKELAKAFPNTNIVIDHAGVEQGLPPLPFMPVGMQMPPPPPPSASNSRPPAPTMDDWKKAVVELASFKNIFIKLGGFSGIAAADRKDHSSAELAAAAGPYILWCIKQFGSERCMFESNYPIESIDYSFNVIWNAFKLITHDIPESERKNLFYNTAVKAYRL